MLLVVVQLTRRDRERVILSYSPKDNFCYDVKILRTESSASLLINDINETCKFVLNLTVFIKNFPANQNMKLMISSQDC